MAIGSVDDNLESTATIPGKGIFEDALLLLFGIIGGLLGALRASAIPIIRTIENRVNHLSPNALLDAGTVAVGVVKGVIDPGTGASEAQYGGIDRERFQSLVDLTGNAPAWGDLLDQWRRGLIGDGELEHGIKTGLLRNEWVGFVKNLRYVPLTFTSYLSAAVRGHMSEGDAVAKAGTLGINAADATLVFETLGNPPGVMQMLELLNRGIWDEGKTRLGIMESDIKPKYTDDILQLRVYLPPPRTVTALLRNGSISSEKARELFVKHGLPPDLADAYVADAAHGRTASHKQVAVGTVKSLYSDHLVDRATATAWLVRIGYGADDAGLILDLADYEAKQKLRTQAINRVRSLYVGKHIDEATAKADLTRIGVEIDQQAALLNVWEIEQTTPSKELTLAQLTALAKAQVIDQATWTARVQALGYSAADAGLLALLDFPQATP